MLDNRFCSLLQKTLKLSRAVIFNDQYAVMFYTTQKHCTIQLVSSSLVASTCAISCVLFVNKEFYVLVYVLSVKFG